MNLENILNNLRKDLVQASKAIITKKLVEIGEGNISARIPGKNEFLITPSYNNYENMELKDAVRMQFDGIILEVSEGHKPSNEWRLHAAIYRDRSSANYVIHTHSPYATMMAIMQRNIPVILEEMALFLGGEIQVAEIGRANTFDVAEKALIALGKNNGALLANHGPVICARSIEKAVKYAELIEKMSFLYYGTSILNAVNIIEPEEVAFFRRYFEEEHSTFNDLEQ
jgi:L-ribulose-5-phosphate 4-epimerase